MIKICGTTSVEDARLAQRAGANCIGLIVNHSASPRHVSLQAARHIAASVGAIGNVGVVAVSVNQELEALLHIAAALKPRALQLHGDEPPELVRALKARAPDVEVWKVLARADLESARRYTGAGAEALLIDARAETAAGTLYGGTGQTADWRAARVLSDAGYRVILAGGLTPANVAAALEIARPWGVDVVSGVEESKGVKDPQKVRDFVANAAAAQSAARNAD